MNENSLDAAPPAASHNPTSAGHKPHIVVIVPRGEAVRNFLYSSTLAQLAQRARVTLLSVAFDEEVKRRFEPMVERIVPLEEFRPPRHLTFLRMAIEDAHFRWLWSAVARNKWDREDAKAQQQGRHLFRMGEKTLARMLAHRPILEKLTAYEQTQVYNLRPTDQFDKLFAEIKPDLVFNGSHIHGFAGELPSRVAAAMGIPVAGFVFSWDNLTSRSRIMVPYDYYIVWNQGMKKQLLEIYPKVRPENVFVTGTPQLDFHFNPEFFWSREELCQRMGLDPARPYVLYTTGIDRHFPEEHRHVQKVVELLREVKVEPRPQMLVRVYIKGASDEMKALAQQNIPDVVFPPVEWDADLFMPHYSDLFTYTNQVRHAALSINAASTVTLEFLLQNKPVINLDFDPPGSKLPYWDGFQRHIRFDHFWAVAQSGATMLARSVDDLRAMMERGLNEPEAGSEKRRAFVKEFFNDLADGHAGDRVADVLFDLAAQRAGKH